MNYRNKYQIDAVFLCFIIYFLFNFLFLIFAAIFDNVLVEGRYFNFDASILGEFFIYQTLSLFFIYIFYLTKKNNNQIRRYGNKVGWFLLISQLFLLFVSYKYGYGTVGIMMDESTTPYLLYMFLNFFPIEYFVFIMAPRLKSNKFFYLNIVICIISSIFRGWISVIFLAFFLYIIRSGGVLISQFLKYFFILISVLIFSPLFVEFKWAIRAGDEINISQIYTQDNIKESLNYILARMQSLGQLEIINRDKVFYQLSYDRGEIKPYYLDGVIQDILFRQLSLDVKEPLMSITAKYSFGATQSNLNTGIIGWLIVLGASGLFFIVYIVISLFIVYFLVNKFGTKIESQILGVFSILMLFHGFISFFFWFVLYLILIIFLSKTKQFECFFYR
ncbi:MAG: oligosaccharide repeat unit polymerase [Candidatus Acinetobacter avistercoris]|nr:oligosaccharide repeat unit polymerase [Candidatus Acinetobacter avistercoris]